MNIKYSIPTFENILIYFKKFLMDLPSGPLVKFLKRFSTRKKLHIKFLMNRDDGRVEGNPTFENI